MCVIFSGLLMGCYTLVKLCSSYWKRGSSLIRICRIWKFKRNCNFVSGEGEEEFEILKNVLK